MLLHRLWRKFYPSAVQSQVCFCGEKYLQIHGVKVHRAVTLTVHDQSYFEGSNQDIWYICCVSWSGRFWSAEWCGEVWICLENTDYLDSRYCSMHFTSHCAIVHCGRIHSIFVPIALNRCKNKTSWGFNENKILVRHVENVQTTGPSSTDNLMQMVSSIKDGILWCSMEFYGVLWKHSSLIPKNLVCFSLALDLLTAPRFWWGGRTVAEGFSDW